MPTYYSLKIVYFAYRCSQAYPIFCSLVCNQYNTQKCLDPCIRTRALRRPSLFIVCSMTSKQRAGTWGRGYVREPYPADRSTRQHMMRMRHTSTIMMSPQGTPTIRAMVRYPWSSPPPGPVALLAVKEKVKREGIGEGHNYCHKHG